MSNLSLTFIQTALFTALWKDRYELTDDDLRSLEELISRNPLAGAVVQGGGGVRKIRFAPPSSRRGKSGGFRVIYLAVIGHHTVFPFSVYSKSDQTNLTSADIRNMNSIASVLKKSLQAREKE